MSYPAVTFAQLLENSTREELEQLTALLQGYLSVEHNEEGKHTAVTATSITTTGAVTVGGALNVSGATVIGDLSAAALTGSEGVVLTGTETEAQPGAGAASLGEGSPIGDVFAVRIASVGGTDDIAGLNAGSLVQAGRVYAVWQDNANRVGVRHDSASAATTAHRFYTAQGVTTYLRQYEGMLVWYDTAASRWRVIGPRGPAVIRPAQITANQNNYAPTGWADADAALLDLDAARSITGFAATYDGDSKRVLNISGFDLTVSHNSGSSSAGNKVICPGGGDYTLTSASGMWLTYDATAAFWRVTDK